MIRITVTGSFKNAENFTKRMIRREQFAQLDKFGPVGVNALSSATPRDTSDTANSWYYEIERRPGNYKIHWLNRNAPDDLPIAAIIQYGHATKNGGYVQGIDYINPALRPVFKQIVDDMWKVVTK